MRYLHCASCGIAHHPWELLIPQLAMDNAAVASESGFKGLVGAKGYFSLLFHSSLVLGLKLIVALDW